MSVNLLLCEGVSSSPDVRVLGKLLAGLCQVKPMDGKYGMGTRIIARREPPHSSVVAGMLDGDFIKEWAIPINKPREWQSNDKKIHFGWCWERKEIENYLIDPLIVERALGGQSPNMDQYRTALAKARDKIADYQAARTALSASRVRFKDLPSSFGRKRGKIKHTFPDCLSEDSCNLGIKNIVEDHQTEQIIELSDVQKAFQQYLSECRPGGIRYQDYLHAFAGKDLFWAVDEWFEAQGYSSAWVFCEKVAMAVWQSQEDIADWVAEWSELRQLIGIGVKK